MNFTKSKKGDDEMKEIESSRTVRCTRVPAQSTATYTGSLVAFVVYLFSKL